MPGCYKLPGALRDNRLLDRLGATDAGYVVPPRYDRSNWKPGDGVFNAAAIATYSIKLADRLSPVLASGDLAVVLGGDCSILLGSALALRRRGRYGLAFLDGHSDFRHPGNSTQVGAAAGEDLALVTGRGQADLTTLEGARPYFADADVAVAGTRTDDAYVGELSAAGIPVWPADGLATAQGVVRAAEGVLEHLQRHDLAGFWVHLDADILDASVMPAVDTPSHGGLSHAQLALLLGELARSSRCMGVEITVYDPDLDPDGQYAAALTDTVVAALV